MRRTGCVMVVVGLGALAQAQSTSAPPAQAAAPPAASAVSNEVQALTAAARERMSQENWSGAAALLEKARQLDPANNDVAFGLGTAYSQMGKYKESMPLLE